MKYVINEQTVLSRAPEGPLSECIKPFADFLSAQGYALNSVHQQVHLTACFSQWLKQQDVALREMNFDHVKQYLVYRARHRKPGRGDTAALRHVIDWLRSQGVIPAETVPEPRLTPAQRCVQGYEHYLRETRGLAEPTIVNYAPFIERFLTDRGVCQDRWHRHPIRCAMAPRVGRPPRRRD